MKYLAVFFVTLFLIEAKAANNEEDAIKKAAEAALIQTGISDNVTKYVDKKVPDEVKEVVGNVYPVAKIFIEQKVEFKWTF